MGDETYNLEHWSVIWSLIRRGRSASNKNARRKASATNKSARRNASGPTVSARRNASGPTASARRNASGGSESEEGDSATLSGPRSTRSVRFLVVRERISADMGGPGPRRLPCSAMRLLGSHFVLADIEVLTRWWEEHSVVVDSGLASRDADARSLGRQGWNW